MRIRNQDLLALMLFLLVLGGAIIDLVLHYHVRLSLENLAASAGVAYLFYRAPREECRDTYRLWLLSMFSEISLATVFRYYSLRLLEFPLLAAAIVTLVAVLISFRVKRGYYPGVLNWFSHKGLLAYKARQAKLLSDLKGQDRM